MILEIEYLSVPVVNQHVHALRSSTHYHAAGINHETYLLALWHYRCMQAEWTNGDVNVAAAHGPAYKWAVGVILSMVDTNNQ